MLIDTHAHLNFKDFQKSLDQTIRRSVKAGVKKIICVSSDLEDSKKAVEITKKYPGNVFAAVGIHPHDTSSRLHNTDTPAYRYQTKEQVRKLAKLASQPETVAIGECGLDYSPAPPGEKDRTKKEQIFLFQKQIKIAILLNKPILVHSREAFDDTVEMINNLPQKNILRGVFHCYAAGKRGIAKVNKLSFYFGVDGNLTYDEGLQNVFKEIPLEKILLETDCPFLAPEPHRGQRSEPAHVKIIAKFLAKLKGVSFEKVAQITTQNAKNLFGI